MEKNRIQRVPQGQDGAQLHERLGDHMVQEQKIVGMLQQAMQDQGYSARAIHMATEQLHRKFEQERQQGDEGMIRGSRQPDELLLQHEQVHSRNR